MAKKTLAETRTEREEAAWFEENQDQLLKLFEQAEKKGSLQLGARSASITLSKAIGGLAAPKSQKVMLRIPTGDLDRARRQAEGKGLGAIRLTSRCSCTMA